MPIYQQIGYPIALRIQGRVGYAYIFRWRKGQQEIMKYYYPYDPKSTNVVANRQKLARAVTYWQGFDNLTKQFYNSKKYPCNMSGYNRYMRYYLKWG